MSVIEPLPASDRIFHGDPRATPAKSEDVASRTWPPVMFAKRRMASAPGLMMN
jgi:hypothetical protein